VRGSQGAIVASSVAWMDTFFDSAANLIRYPGDTGRHAVRESLWYAAGLLVQRRDAAAPRALRAIDAVLSLQFDRPCAVWDGTWPRARQEPQPQEGAVIWRDYDPNWRQFIGCLLGVLVCDYADVLGTSRCDRIRESIDRAVRGEPAERIVASYSNIALMHAWLLCEYGDRSSGERLAAQVERLYGEEGGLHEFNSPTYYGVDLWGLALWRRSTSASLVEAGTRLEAALWRDVATFYHVGMRNLCGPYDRAYGMDMTRYASLLGLWTWWACGDDVRPFPDVTRPFDHAHDFCAAPLIALAPPTLGDEERIALSTLPIDRVVTRRVAHRTITATLRPDLMLGAVDRASTDAAGQVIPVTAHWIDVDGTVAWLGIRGELSARASDAHIELRGDTELRLQCSSAVTVSNEAWNVGGRRIETGGVEIRELPEQKGRFRYALKLRSGEAVLRFA